MISEEQASQSRMNFKRLILSVAHQNEMDIKEVVDHVLTAIIAIMVEDSSVELTTAYLRTLADSLTSDTLEGETKH